MLSGHEKPRGATGTLIQGARQWPKLMGFPELQHSSKAPSAFMGQGQWVVWEENMLCVNWDLGLNLYSVTY